MKQQNVISHEVTNGGEEDILRIAPYVIQAKVTGTAMFLFHRWNCEAVQEKADARKGSDAKKSDNVESYVYRLEDGELAIPTEYFRQSIIHAAKFRQDPRSPRKSAMDLYKAGVANITDLAGLGTAQWDFMDKRRVVVQRSGITRSRPAMTPGWKVEFQMQVLLPEYITPAGLNDVLQYAGRIVGVGDFRPTFGRFQVNAFDVVNLA